MQKVLLLFFIIVYTYPVYGVVISTDATYRYWQSFTNTQYINGITISDEYIFVATTMGIDIYHKSNEKWVETLTISNGLPSNNVTVIGIDTPNIIWCVTKKGIVQYYFKAGIWKIYDKSDGIGDSIDIKSIGITKDYVLFEAKGNISFWFDKNQMCIVSGTPTPSISSDITWFGDKDKTLQKLCQKNIISSIYYTNLKEESYKFTCALIDNNNLWLGTWGDGLYKYEIPTGNWKRFRNGLSKSIGATIILPDKDSLWIINPGVFPNIPGEIIRYFPYENRWEYFSRNSSAGTNTLISNWITCGCVGDDFIWFGSQDGVCRYEKSKKTWSIFTSRNGLIDNHVKSILYDKHIIWIITRWGINVFDTDTNKWKHIFFPSDIRRYIEYLTAVQLEKEYILLAFSWINIVKFCKTTYSWEDFSLPEKFHNTYIYCMISDDKNIWFGTDKGSLKYDKKKKTWKILSRIDGLISNKVFAIGIDEKYIFFGTPFGVSQYCRYRNYFRNYTTNDGLIDNDIRSIAIIGDYVYFSTPKGITAFHYKNRYKLIENENLEISARITSDKISFIH
jgi:ligand-binding sensor domain-containing protein